MKLEAIGGVSMGNLGLKIRGKIDDIDGAERTFLWANTATNT